MIETSYDLIIVGRANPTLHAFTDGEPVCGTKLLKRVMVQQVAIAPRLHEAPISCPECVRLTN